MRTVTSFGNENALEEAYDKRLEFPLSIVKKKANQSGIAFSAS